MRKRLSLLTALYVAMTMLLLSISLGTPETVAGGGPCTPPCPDWWVKYDYIFPPCSDVVKVDVLWSNGQWSNVSSVVDGTFHYPTPPPLSAPTTVLVNGVNIPLTWASGFLIPYTCDPTTPPGTWCLEVRARCTPCLEIEIKLVPGPC